MKVPGATVDTDISDLIQQVNDQAEHVNSLTNSAVIIANGSIAVNYDAPTKTYPSKTVQISTGVNTGFMAYLTRSDRPGQVYALPYHDLILNPATQFRIAASMFLIGQVLTTDVNIISNYPSPPATLTFYYYILQQAVDQTSS